MNVAKPSINPKVIAVFENCINKIIVNKKNIKKIFILNLNL